MPNKLIKAVRDPKKILLYAIGKGALSWIDDERYLRTLYRVSMNKKLDLSNPQVFNEKLQWLKLYDRRPAYTMMVDKYAVRKYIADKLGEEYLIPLLGVWDDPDEIDFNMLPNQFVLKCNHNSGLGMCICKDKGSLDVNKVRQDLKRGLKQNYYKYVREWPYKNVRRRIIAEKYMVDESGIELKDYKFMCFNGKVEMEFVCSDRYADDGLKVTFFDTQWNRLPFERHYPASKKEIKPPINLKKMIEMAECLAKNIPFVRIDFYEVNGRIYFGEITFYPGGGFEEFEPEAWDYILGNLIDLKEVQHENHYRS